MRTISINRTHGLSSFVNFARHVGVPVDRYLLRARLPLSFAENPNTWILRSRMMSFMEQLARCEGIDDFGFHAAVHSSLNGLLPPIKTQVLRAPTLSLALSELSGLARLQVSSIRVWLELYGEVAHVCHSDGLSDDGCDHANWHVTHMIVEVMREYLGLHWCPPRILLSSARSFGDKPSTFYSESRIIVGHTHNAIVLPRKLLQTTHSGRSLELSSQPWLSGLPEAPPRDIAMTLIEVLRPYLAEGRPDIDFTARIMGYSRRTFQRRLVDCGLTYQKLITRTRFAVALEKLEDQDKPLAEISHDLGYSEQTAFSRAFHGWTGLSPGEYRRQRSVHYKDGLESDSHP